jgi:hypothetical protein
MTTMKKQAIVYLNHAFDKTLWRGYQRIQLASRGIADVYFVLNLSSPDVPQGAQDTFSITPAQREALGHPSRQGTVGWWMDTSPSHTKVMQAGIDRAVLAFRQLKPEYEYYWVVEYDVEFSGSWAVLFNAFSDNKSDLLCTNIYRHETNPTWDWWKSLVWPLGPKPELVRGFFPFARLSAKAIDALIEAGRNGVDGIYELVWPTVLSHEGFVIEDIGGDGPFVRPENINRWYTSTLANPELAPGSFVSRPIRPRPGLKRNTLWHPVKRRFIRHILRRMAARLSRSGS